MCNNTIDWDEEGALELLEHEEAEVAFQAHLKSCSGCDDLLCRTHKAQEAFELERYGPPVV